MGVHPQKSFSFQIHQEHERPVRLAQYLLGVCGPGVGITATPIRKGCLLHRPWGCPKTPASVLRRVRGADARWGAEFNIRVKTEAISTTVMPISLPKSSLAASWGGGDMEFPCGHTHSVPTPVTGYGAQLRGWGLDRQMTSAPWGLEWRRYQRACSGAAWSKG